jgi:hypothetical protein
MIICEKSEWGVNVCVSAIASGKLDFNQIMTVCEKAKHSTYVCAKLLNMGKFSLMSLYEVWDYKVWGNLAKEGCLSGCKIKELCDFFLNHSRCRLYSMCQIAGIKLSRCSMMETNNSGYWKDNEKGNYYAGGRYIVTETTCTCRAGRRTI